MYISAAIQGISYTHKKSTFGVNATYKNIFIDRSTMSSINEYYSSMTGISPYCTYDFGFLKSQTSYKHIDKNSKAYISRSGKIDMLSQNFYSFLTKTTMINIGVVVLVKKELWITYMTTTYTLEMLY